MTVEETAQIAPGLVIDYDVDGNTIGSRDRQGIDKRSIILMLFPMSLVKPMLISLDRKRSG